MPGLLARRAGLAAILLALGAVPVVPALHATFAAEAADLQEVERALAKDRDRAKELERKSQATAAEIAALQGQLVAAANAAQDSESQLTQLEDAMAQLSEDEAEAMAALKRERGRLGDTLGALQRLSLQPPEALILGPGRPVDTVRSAMLLRVAVPTIEMRARDLRSRLDRIGELRSEIALRRQQQELATGELAEENRRLADLIARKTAMQQTTEAERAAAQKRATALADQAKDLRDLLERLRVAAEEEAARTQTAMLSTPPASDAPEPDAVAPDGPPAVAGPVRLTRPPNLRAFPGRGEKVIQPARGKLIAAFGEANEGLTSRGVTFRTRSAARVVAPFDGQVVFRGPFRGYGQILIIEHSGGYHTMLAGLGRTDAVVGQWVLAGEPVGIMSPDANGDPKLYMELRRGGQPINPSPWLGIQTR